MGDKLILVILMVGTVPTVLALVLFVCIYPGLQSEQVSAEKSQTQNFMSNIYRFHL